MKCSIRCVCEHFSHRLPVHQVVYHIETGKISPVFGYIKTWNRDVMWNTTLASGGVKELNTYAHSVQFCAIALAYEHAHIDNSTMLSASSLAQYEGIILFECLEAWFIVLNHFILNGFSGGTMYIVDLR